jgi:hypothetical protein
VQAEPDGNSALALVDPINNVGRDREPLDPAIPIRLRDLPRNRACPGSFSNRAARDTLPSITGSGSARRRRWLRDLSRSRLHPCKESATMANENHAKRVHDLAYEIAEQNAVIRGVVAKSLEVLQSPLPDTFMGRKTQEPFPKEAK